MAKHSKVNYKRQCETSRKRWRWRSDQVTKRQRSVIAKAFQQQRATGRARAYGRGQGLSYCTYALLQRSNGIYRWECVCVLPLLASTYQSKCIAINVVGQKFCAALGRSPAWLRALMACAGGNANLERWVKAAAGEWQTDILKWRRSCQPRAACNRNWQSSPGQAFYLH